MTTQRYVELYEDLYPNQERETINEIALNIHEAKNSKTEDSSMNVEVLVMPVFYYGDTCNQVFSVFSMVICQSFLEKSIS